MQENELALERNIISKIEQLREDIEAIQQPRSNFALEHFVVAPNDTPGRQRMQVVLELQVKLFNIKRAQIEEQKILVQRSDQMRKAKWGIGSTRQYARLEVEMIDVNLAEMRLARLGNMREADALLKILDKLPRMTYEQLQAEEPIYWRKRLARQGLQDLRSMGVIGAGNMEAIRNLMTNLGGVETSLLFNDDFIRSLATLEVPADALVQKELSAPKDV